MNSKKMVKVSNIIGFIAVLALIYWVIVFIISLPIVIICLFFGNYLSTQKTENELKYSADGIIKSYKSNILNNN
jgi:uncharacterized membrane protein